MQEDVLGTRRTAVPETYGSQEVLPVAFAAAGCKAHRQRRRELPQVARSQVPE